MSETYYKNPYSASGAGGRWNPRGTRMIYAGSSASVTLLEYLCIKGSAVSARPWHMVVYEVTDEKLVGRVEPGSLPDDWQALPHGKATQDFGRVWLEEMEFPFLMVPSARMDIRFYPAEHNLLINPDYPDLPNLLRVADVIRFDYLLNS